MSNTQTSDSPNLDREDPATLEQSTRRQWSLVGHLLHLPPLETIASENQRVVAGRIANFISTVRGGVANAGVLRNVLHGEYLNRIQNIEQVNAVNEPVRAAGSNLNIRTAEAWLQTIYANFSEQELKNMISTLPASILPINTERRWEGTANFGATGTPPVGGLDYDFSIDLTHSIWRTGNQQAIQQRLVGRTPAEAGMICDYTDELTANDAITIFASTCNVVNPLLSLKQIVLENIPTAGQRSIVDLSFLIRNNPEIANMNANAMRIELQGNSFAIFRRCFRRINANTSEVLDTGVAALNGMIPLIVNGLFAHESRRPADVFGSRELSLDRAIERRQPVEQLVSGSASNRELLLALAMIQRDPAAASALETSQSNVTTIRSRLVANDVMLDAAQALKDLKEAKTPLNNNNTIDDGIAAMQYIATSASGASVPGNINLYTSPPLTAGQYAQAVASGLPASYTYTNTVATLGIGGVVITPAKNNLDSFLKIAEQAQQKIKQYEESRERIEKIHNALQSMISMLRQGSVTEAQLATGTNYNDLRRFIVNGAGNYEVQDDQIVRAMNIAEVIRQFNRALREANPDSRTDLRDLSYYEKQRETIIGELEKAEAGQQSGLNGSEACRAVVERGLSHEGLRDQELKDTAQYMFNSIQKTRESESDLRMYADRQFADGEDNQNAQSSWNNGKSFRSFWTLGMRRTDFYNTYLQNLQNDVTRFGFDLATPNAQHNFGNHLLPHLIDVYFRTKAMTELDPKDPHYLPSSETIVRFQRQLYMHIVDRAQRSFDRSTGMTTEELNAFRSRGLNIEVDKLPTMTIQERMSYVREFMGNTEAYMNDATNKKNFDRLVNGAYSPIQEAIERHRWRSPATWITKAWNVVTGPFASAAGAGVGHVWNKKKDIAVYAAIGTAALPVPFVGTALGAGYGYLKGLGKNKAASTNAQTS